MKALVGAALVASTAGCVQPFPAVPSGLMGYHPNPYSLAFESAATEAFIEARTGRNMYALLDDRPYSLGGNDLCTEAGIEAFLVQQISRCDLLAIAPTAECTDTVQCMRFRISPPVLAEPRYMAAVEAALRRPCAHITDWRLVKWPDVHTSLGLAPKVSATLLRCAGRPVIGTSVTRSADGDYFIVHFDQGLTNADQTHDP